MIDEKILIERLEERVSIYENLGQKYSISGYYDLSKYEYDLAEGIEDAIDIVEDLAEECNNGRISCENLTVEEADIIFSIARCDMVRERVSRDLYYHRNSLRLKVNKIKEKTGLDPYKFYDLVKLLDMAEEVG